MAARYRLIQKVPDGYWTRAQVCDYLGVHLHTVVTYERHGLKRSARKLGNRILYEIRHVKEFRRKHLRRVED